METNLEPIIPTEPMEVIPSKPIKKSNLPNKDSDTIQVCTDVIAVWQKRSDIKLNWITLAAFKTAVVTFEGATQFCFSAQGARSVFSEEMKKLNAEISKSISFPKNYLAEVYGKASAPAYYKELGILKIGKTYVFPADMDKRLISLRQMVVGIAKHGLSDKPYGSAFWEGKLASYEKILADARASQSQSSTAIAQKKESKIVIRKVLNGLILTIRANNPQNYKDELRTWGFLKERY